MPHSLPWLDPTAEIKGGILRVVFAAFTLSTQARRLLRKHGLSDDPEPKQWYPLKAWLGLLAEIETLYGPQTVYAVGQQVVEHSPWPAQTTTLTEALSLLNEVYHTSLRGSNVGYYRVEAQDASSICVVCFTPMPLPFDWGMITGVARQFRPPEAVRVRVVPEPYQAGDPPELKRFQVNW